MNQQHSQRVRQELKLQLFKRPCKLISTPPEVKTQTVQGVIGEGAHAVVKKCRLKSNSQRELYAVKELRSGDIEIVIGLKQTFFIQRLLSHPCIAQAHELFINEVTERLCLVMEYLPYPSLEKLIQSGFQFDECLLRDIAVKLLGTLEYMHSRGVAHRDLKPDNILVNIEFDQLLDLKIIDFNVSKKFLKKSKQNMSHEKCEMWTQTGCLYYCAPEILMEETQGYDEKVDIWSVGVMLYQLSQGKLPFYRDSIYETIEAIINCDVDLMSLQEYSQQFIDFLKKLLNKVPVLRLSAQGIYFFFKSIKQQKIELLQEPWINTAKERRSYTQEEINYANLFSQRLMESQSLESQNAEIQCMDDFLSKLNWLSQSVKENVYIQKRNSSKFIN